MSTSLGMFANSFFKSLQGMSFGIPNNYPPSFMGGQMQSRPWDNRTIEPTPSMHAGSNPPQTGGAKPYAGASAPRGQQTRGQNNPKNRGGRDRGLLNPGVV